MSWRQLTHWNSDSQFYQICWKMALDTGFSEWKKAFVSYPVFKLYMIETHARYDKVTSLKFKQAIGEKCAKLLAFVSNV